MSANTKIEWADHTFNPWIGCTKVGPGKKEAPWVGKTGIVERQVGPEAWDVHFMPGTAKLVTGKAAGVLQSFHASELEVVEGAA